MSDDSVCRAEPIRKKSKSRPSREIVVRLIFFFLRDKYKNSRQSRWSEVGSRRHHLAISASGRTRRLTYLRIVANTKTRLYIICKLYITDVFNIPCVGVRIYVYVHQHTIYVRENGFFYFVFFVIYTTPRRRGVREPAGGRATGAEVD